MLSLLVIPLVWAIFGAGFAVRAVQRRRFLELDAFQTDLHRLRSTPDLEGGTPWRKEQPRSARRSSLFAFRRAQVAAGLLLLVGLPLGNRPLLAAAVVLLNGGVLAASVLLPVRPTLRPAAGPAPRPVAAAPAAVPAAGLVRAVAPAPAPQVQGLRRWPELVEVYSAP